MPAEDFDEFEELLDTAALGFHVLRTALRKLDLQDGAEAAAEWLEKYAALRRRLPPKKK